MSANPRKFRKKTTVIEAVQLRWSTWSEMCEFLGDMISESNPAREIGADDVADTCGETGPTYMALDVETPTGPSVALHGEWIIKDWLGAFYVCGTEVFAQLYDPIDEVV